MIMQDLCNYMQSQGTDLSSLRTYNQVFVTHCSFVYLQILLFLVTMCFDNETCKVILAIIK